MEKSEIKEILRKAIEIEMGKAAHHKNLMDWHQERAQAIFKLLEESEHD